MRSFTVNGNDGGQRLDKFVSKAVWGLPPSLMYKFIRKKRIKVNGKKASEKQMLAAGDVVEMFIPDQFFENKAKDETEDLLRVKPTLDIVYEDDNILLCNKKPGVLSHAGDGGDPSGTVGSEAATLIYRIKAYLCQKGEYFPNEENSFAPSLCNRIDRNTGGIVIAAKNAEALREMNLLIKDGAVVKKYLCAVHGKMPRKTDILKAWLFKNTKTGTVTVTDERVKGSKEIITEYRVLEVNREKDLSLLEITLHTGRTHQIRAHMAFIGHPLLGEGKYAHNKSDREMGFSYQALYSYKTEFKNHEGALSYLGGRSFGCDTSDIAFLKLFGRRQWK